MVHQQKQIVVDISPAGNVKFDAQGFKGCGCEEATQALVLTLGGEAEATRKPEYSMPASTAQANKLTF